MVMSHMDRQVIQLMTLTAAEMREHLLLILTGSDLRAENQTTILLLCSQLCSPVSRQKNNYFIATNLCLSIREFKVVNNPESILILEARLDHALLDTIDVWAAIILMGHNLL